MKAGGKLDTKDAGLIEKLRRLDHLHFLTIFGARVWTAIHVTNWRHRECAAKAVLHFIEVPLVRIFEGINCLYLFSLRSIQKEKQTATYSWLVLKWPD